MPGRLIPTKLHPRPARPRRVERARLIERLEAGTELPLTLVRGPAGSGKSTAAVAWLARSDRAVAWLSLDAGDNHPNRFLAYLLAAAHTVEPSIGAEAAELLAARRLDAAQFEAALADELVIPLAERDEALVIVLDDLHLIDEPVIHAGLDWLLEHRPAGLRLLALSRSEPPLALARMRGRGELAEIGVDELRFSPAEARRFYTKVMGLELAEAEVAELERRTEGWPAGAQLVALSLRRGRELASGEHGLVADYLLDEVFAGLDEGTRELLLATALLERVCAPLAEAVHEGEGARTELAAIERAGLFLIPLDGHGRWFRYHHLFCDFLRRRAEARGEAWLSERHRRAATWLAARDLREEAFEHALAAGDPSLITALFEGWAAELLLANHTGVVRAWLAEIPEAITAGRPCFAFMAGWCEVIVGQLHAGRAKIAAASVALEAGAEASEMTRALITGLGPILMIAARLRAGEIDEALAESRARRTTLEGARGSLEGRAVAELELAIAGHHLHEGLAELERGGLEAARESIAAAVEGMRADKALATVALTHLAQVQRRLGQLDEAEALARRALAFAEHSGQAQLSAGGLARVAAASVALERGDPRRALAEVEAGRERLRLLHDLAYLTDAAELLARAKAALGQVGEAVEVVDEALEQLAATDMVGARRRLTALREQLLRGALRPAPALEVADFDDAGLPPITALTEREGEVLALVATGGSNREIARRLHVSVGTVKTHMHRILAKLGVDNRTRAVHRARAAGLLK